MKGGDPPFDGVGGLTGDVGEVTLYDRLYSGSELFVVSAVAIVSEAPWSNMVERRNLKKFRSLGRSFLSFGCCSVSVFPDK